MTETGTSEPLVALTRQLGPKLKMVVAIVGAALVIGQIIAWSSSPIVLVALVALTIIATWLAAIDLAVYRLPNAIVGPLALVVTIWLIAAGWAVDDWSRGLWSLAVGLIAAALFLVGNLVAGIGMGDVKYAYPVFAVAAWFGPTTVQRTLLVMTFSAAIVAVGVMINQRRGKVPIAYGPYMSLGLAVGTVTAGLSL